MASAEYAPAAAQGDEEAAELVLAQITGSRVTAAMGTTGRRTAIMVFTVRTAIGALLRLWWVPPAPAIAGACLLAVAITAGLPLLRREGSSEPAWVEAACRHQQSLASRGLPPANMEVISRCLAGLPPPAFAYISACNDPRPSHMGTCQIAGVLTPNRRRLVLIGEHLAAGPHDVLAAVLGHESGHTARWQAQLGMLAEAAGSYGWLIIGWAVPWPVLIPAAAGLLAALTAVSWLREITCDVRGAGHAGPRAMLDYLIDMKEILAAARTVRPRRQRYMDRVLNWLTVPHPPFWLRCAVLRCLRAAKGS